MNNHQSIKILLKYHLIGMLLCYSMDAQSQQNNADTVKHLNEVVVQGYLLKQPIIQSPASAAILDKKELEKNSQQSLLPSVNTIPGIRMEERSPGSYRLSIRGSLLRSPFGVRNIKVYLNNLPLTDASGNTYINLVDPALLDRIEFLKGPDGSLFGANSGGVVLLESSNDRDSTVASGNISGGSYGMFRESITLQNSSGKFGWKLGQAFQRADGYRQQSFMKRFTGTGSGTMIYGQDNSLKLFILYSDLHYQTPGGLTLQQFQDNPQQARPATATAPSAIEQQTGIYNKTFFGGITNNLRLSSSLKHVVSVFGTLTDYENPFITNYEIRNEKNAGLRTYFEYSLSKNKFNLQWNTGLEGQCGNQEISNYNNNAGQQGSLKSADTVDIGQVFYFTRVSADIAQRLTGEIAVSLNQYNYHFKGSGDRTLANEWMPRVGACYNFNNQWAVRVSFSRGYSPPSIAEIRPSGSVINNQLQAESGWNREAGIRFLSRNNRLQIDGSVFRFDLNNAIVRRTDENDEEYFLNAGGTNQTGTELVVHAWAIPLIESGAIRGLEINASFTYNHFIFDQYQDATSDYSGNSLTGVPKTVGIFGVTVYLPKHISVFVQSNMTSRLPLNDANSQYAEKYNLLQARLLWRVLQTAKLKFEIFAGGDNLLNEKYSLGNDINAFGGRYYNAAPLRNFYGGLSITL